MKVLVIAEKPSVARDIARVLGCKKNGQGMIEGEKYIITWGLGTLLLWLIRRSILQIGKSGRWKYSQWCPNHGS